MLGGWGRRVVREGSGGGGRGLWEGVRGIVEVAARYGAAVDYRTADGWAWRADVRRLRRRGSGAHAAGVMEAVAGASARAMHYVLVARRTGHDRGRDADALAAGRLERGPGGDRGGLRHLPATALAGEDSGRRYAVASTAKADEDLARGAADVARATARREVADLVADETNRLIRLDLPGQGDGRNGPGRGAGGPGISRPSGCSRWKPKPSWPTPTTAGRGPPTGTWARSPAR